MLLKPVAKVTGAQERAEPANAASKAGAGVGGGGGGGAEGKVKAAAVTQVANPKCC